MFLYNIRIAIKSLRRNPILTLLLVSAIALGICVSTTFIALRYLFQKDPMPGKSQTLSYVRLDSWDPQRAYVAEDPKSIPPQITYRDMRGLMESKIPTRQTGAYRARFFVYPDPKVSRPYRENVRLVFSDFFPMFNVPFQYGSGWDKAADAKPEPVVVIDHATNQKLFGGVDSVGKSIRVGEREFKVVGVLREWRPTVRYYDLNPNFNVAPEAIYMPFNFTPILEIYSGASIDGWKSSGTDYASFLDSEDTWIQLWVELPTEAQQQAYGAFVANYIRDQKKLGRFQRPLHYEVTPLPQLMKEVGIVSPAMKSMSIVSVLFLVVCSLNLVGLLLGKFLARVPEVSVRRALGASKWQVFWQHVVECEVVGVAGGMIGLLMSIGMLKIVGKALPNGQVLSLDLAMVLVSIFLSLVAGVLAGIYPSWRVCTVAPAMQLKVQ